MIILWAETSLVLFFAQAGSHRSMSEEEDRPEPRQRMRSGQRPATLRRNRVGQRDNEGPNQYGRTGTRVYIV